MEETLAKIIARNNELRSQHDVEIGDIVRSISLGTPLEGYLEGGSGEILQPSGETDEPVGVTRDP